MYDGEEVRQSKLQREGAVDDPSFSATNWIEVLQAQASTRPDETLYTFLSEDGSDDARMTFTELDRRAQAVAVAFRDRQVPTGSPVLLLFAPGLDYIAAFFGCIYAGAIPVPAYPPANARQLPRLQAILDDARALFAFTNAAGQRQIEVFNRQRGELRVQQWLLLDDMPKSISECAKPDLNSSDTAWLQYTSGSTGDPKGVMVSHGCSLANARHMGLAVNTRPEERIVYWLPPYHDFGLAGAILYALYWGYPCVLMKPASFLLNPYRWLKAISDHRGTITGAPNFAFDLCVREIGKDKRASLDLSTLRVVLNGAEPIRLKTLDAFTEAFQPCGFNPKAWIPAYGLAEITLMASGQAKDIPFSSATHLRVSRGAFEQGVVELAADEDSVPLVSVGPVLADHRVAIVDPDTRAPCPPNEIGEIWLSGPSVARGYWNRPEQTKETFQARIAGTEEGPYLRTGDLGFLHEGELYIAARLKDLIILRGRNLHPQDLELTIEHSHADLRPHAAAAFTIDVEGEERLVVVQELELRANPPASEVINAALKALVDEHEVADVHALLFVKAGAIPRTSSGKIQRQECRRRFLANEFEPVISWQRKGPRIARDKKPYVAPQTELEKTLAGLAAEVLRTDQVGMHDDFFELGLESLLATQFISKVRETFALELSIDTLLNAPTIAQLSELIGSLQALQGQPAAEAAADEEWTEMRF